MEKLTSWKNFCSVVLFCAFAAMAAHAQTFTSLLDFESTTGDGPEALVRGVDGNFYGVAWSGGSHLEGTAFRITPTGTLTTVYDFCSQSSCTDGANPQWLMLGIDGNLYGGTSQGGDPSCAGCGVILKLTDSGAFSVVYAFPLSSGARPWGLIQGVDGSLYGVANSGGANDYGSVFKLTTAGQLTVLHSFCSQAKCVDGSFPSGTLIQSGNGTLYGATESGGAKGIGTIYKLAPDGTFTTLHSFVGKDGSSPVMLMQGADNIIYGLTSNGGAIGQCPNSSVGCGTLFQITTAGQLTTLYSFCAQSGCADGTNPSTLVQGSDGNLYGGTSLGGVLSCGRYQDGCGTLFQFTSAGTLTTLHTFEATDGDSPNVLLQDTDGSFYGVTLNGGDVNLFSCSGGPGCGTVFNLSTGLGPFVTFTRNFGKVGQIGGILGRGLIGTTAVWLNGTPASFTVVSDTSIRATVPTGATSGLVTVQTPSGTLTSNTIFTVIP
jgi:uncharacterized repeat protein (TIGR03803 family)